MGEKRSVPALPLLALVMPLVVMPPLVGPRPEPRPDLPPAAAAADGRELECECVRVGADIDACLPIDPSAAAADAAADDNDDWLC